MFEVGFTELLLIFVLGLVVLGPRKLPQVAAQIGRWVGRARTLARQFREQLEEEASLEQSAARRAAPASPDIGTPPPAATAAAPPTEDLDTRHNPGADRDPTLDEPVLSTIPPPREPDDRANERGT